MNKRAAGNAATAKNRPVLNFVAISITLTVSSARSRKFCMTCYAS
jgi:hypothetical protein